MKHKTFVLLGLALLAPVLAPSAARSDRGAVLSVRLVDSAAVPADDHAVVVANLLSGVEHTARTGADGGCELKGLVAGRYRVRPAGSPREELVTLAAGERRELVLVLGVATVHDALTVTAARGARPIASTPQAVTTVDADAISDRLARTPLEAIERVPTVRTLESNPARQRPQLRGLESSRLLILLDGERLNNVRVDASALGIALSLVDIAEIASVEVIRGASSGIYGSDAMGGVVQILTRTPRPGLDGRLLDATWDSSYASATNHVRGALAVESAGERWALRATASAFDAGDMTSGGEAVAVEDVLAFGRFVQDMGSTIGRNLAPTYTVWEHEASGKVPFSGASGRDVKLDLRLVPASGHKLRLLALRSRHDELGSSFSAPPYRRVEGSYRYRDFDKLSLLYEATELAERLPLWSVRAWDQRHERPQNSRNFSVDQGSSWDVTDGVSFFTGRPSTFTLQAATETLNDVRARGAETQATALPWAEAVLTAGLGWTEERSHDSFSRSLLAADGSVVEAVSGRATTPDTTYENTYGFLQLEWRPHPRLDVVGAWRYDRWQTRARPTPGYPPGNEMALIDALLPALAANPGDLDLAGLAGASGLFAGTSDLRTDNGTSTGHVAVMGELPGGLRPYVRWGLSYREPEITVRYLARNLGTPGFTIAIFPNTGLLPEEGESFDVGLKVRRPRWRAELGWFTNDLENLTSFSGSPTLFIPADPERGILPLFGNLHGAVLFQSTNIARARIEGFEATAEAVFEVGRGVLTPFLSFGTLRGENRNPTSNKRSLAEAWYGRDDTPVRLSGSVDDVPYGALVPFLSTFALRYDLPSKGFFVEYEWRHAAATRRVDPDLLVTTDGTQYGTLASLDGYDRHTLRAGLRLGRDAGPRWRLRAAVENLTDELYFYPVLKAPGPGRSFVLGVTVSTGRD